METPDLPTVPRDRCNHSSYLERLFEHQFLGALMRHFWIRDGRRLEVLTPSVDSSGYDVVLDLAGAPSAPRHVQLKVCSSRATRSFNVNVALEHQPRGCAA